MAGLPPREALRAGTLNGATVMGLADEGRIAPGARADFLVVEGDPTQDIACAADPARHRLVVKRGVAEDALGDSRGARRVTRSGHRRAVDLRRKPHHLIHDALCVHSGRP